MRILITSLLNSLPQLGNAFLLFSFLIIIFSILGVEFYSGSFESRCRKTPYPLNN